MRLVINEEEKAVLVLALVKHLESLTSAGQCNKAFYNCQYFKESIKITQELLADLEFPVLAKIKE